MELYTPSQGAGIVNNIIFGRAATGNNSGVINFTYNALNSTTNYIGLGLYGGDAIRVASFTQVSTSTTTGALIVRGGLGVSGAINAASLALTTALPTTSGGTGLSTVGTNTQVLTSNGTTLFWATPGGGGGGTVTTVSASVPTFLSVAVGTPSTTVIDFFPNARSLLLQSRIRAQRYLC